MKFLQKKKAIIIAVVIIAIGLAAWAIWGPRKANKVSFVNTQVERGTISSSITATGTIEPITQVEVGTQVSGIIDKIYVDYNSVVKKGQLLAELDKVNLENSLQSAEANMNTAKTEYEYQLKNYERYKALHDKGLVADSEYDQIYYDYRKAYNDYEVSKNSYEEAKTNLGYAMIYSPIDGIILSKEVEEGQTVAAAMETPTLFIIAQDLTQMQVVADVDEADIGDVAEGQRVTFTVDAYPEDVFEGHVTQVRLEATETNNVVTYEVVIEAPNQNLKLKPGLTANVSIYTLEKQNILTVPAKALRFTPDQEIISKDDKVVKDASIKEDATHKILWQRNGNTFTAIPVVTGISNGSETEIVSGIAEGTSVVMEVVAGTGQDSSTSAASTDTSDESSEERSPFMPGPPDKKKK
ncbi:MAG: efflux RND transporter periplasmic adaptor subunit [Bacteroidaceae bacterium]|jgi:HlyD family secretion protein